ncbi:hypothetical protein ACIOC2_24965 [Streptomyces sp. NPDC088337]|nr:hypothetical protein [Streptomyces sp. NBC_01788]WSB31413.1 hypothetical protein OIE49_04540 [Streptomyces sp. NBC_01788]
MAQPGGLDADADLARAGLWSGRSSMTRGSPKLRTTVTVRGMVFTTCTE